MCMKFVYEDEAGREAVRQRRIACDDLQEPAGDAQLAVARRDARLEVGMAADHSLGLLEQQPGLIAAGGADVDRRLAR